MLHRKVWESLGGAEMKKKGPNGWFRVFFYRG